MLKEKLLKTYKENKETEELIKYCYEQESLYRDGITYSENLRFKAQLNKDSLWDVMVITNYGLLSIRELDKVNYVFQTISTVGLRDKEFYLDSSKTRNLTKLKQYFANEPILANFKADNNGGRNNAEALALLFQFFKRILINNYRNKYEFLWQDTGCSSGIELFNQIQST